MELSWKLLPMFVNLARLQSARMKTNQLVNVVWLISQIYKQTYSYPGIMIKTKFMKIKMVYYFLCFLL